NSRRLAMRKLGLVGVLLFAATWQGCSCSQNNNIKMMNPDGGMDDLAAPEPPDLTLNPDAIAGGDLVVVPPDITLDVFQGMPAPTQVYAAMTHGGMDVSAMATWSVDDPMIGTMGGTTFTANTVKGGTTYVRAQWMGLTGYATVHVKLHANVSDDSCVGCPAF